MEIKSRQANAFICKFLGYCHSFLRQPGDKGNEEENECLNKLFIKFLEPTFLKNTWKGKLAAKSLFVILLLSNNKDGKRKENLDKRVKEKKTS